MIPAAARGSASLPKTPRGAKRDIPPEATRAHRSHCDRHIGPTKRVGCLIEKAVAQQPHRGIGAWWECQTCGQYFTGAMQIGLAEAWWSGRSADEYPPANIKHLPPDRLRHGILPMVSAGISQITRRCKPPSASSHTRETCYVAVRRCVATDASVLLNFCLRPSNSPNSVVTWTRCACGAPALQNRGARQYCARTHRAAGILCMSISACKFI